MNIFIFCCYYYRLYYTTYIYICNYMYIYIYSYLYLCYYERYSYRTHQAISDLQVVTLVAPHEVSRWKNMWKIQGLS